MRKSQNPKSEPNLSRVSLGSSGEAAAARWYESAGYEVLERNWRCREGEIDLIARNADTLIFCEVKTRANAVFGSPVEAVGWAKQSRLRRLAVAYLASRSGSFMPLLRFDIAAVVGGRVQVYEDAF